MTAAEAAAQVASLTAAAQASYNAGTLTGPGAGPVNGYAAPNNTQDAAGMFSDPGLQQLSPTAMGLAAGYYQLPGETTAEYFDPATGQASAAFVAWANSLTADDLGANGQPSNYIAPGGSGPTQVMGEMSGSNLTNFNAEAALINAGATNEDAQNQVLGIGPNQQFVTGANGQQETMAQAAAPQGAGAYRDVSTYDSTLAPAPTGTMWSNAEGSGMSWTQAQLDALTAWYAEEETATNAAVAANTADYESAEAGLQQENVIAAAKAAGADPGSALMYGTGIGGTAMEQQIAETGISAAQTAQIQETYASIANPDEAAAYIAAQDPGNLSPALRLARDNARGAAGDNTDALLGATVDYSNGAAAGDLNDDGIGIKTTYGDVTETDATTGRSIMFGNVVVSEAWTVSGNMGGFDSAMKRLGGAVYGAFMGFVGSFGNPIGAVVGAVEGSGALGGLKMSFAHPFSNVGKSTWGAPEQPGSIGSVVLNLGEAMAYGYFGVGEMGAAGRTAVGVGMGTANGFAASGTKGVAMGAIGGGVGGYLSGSKGPSAADKAQNAWQGFG